MKSAHKGAISFVVTLFAVLAFIDAPLVSYQHLPAHVRGDSASTGGAARGTAGASSSGSSVAPFAGACAPGEGGGRACHDSNCPYLHFLRSNSSSQAPASVGTEVSRVVATAVGPLGARIERNPVQLPLLALAPATSPPVSSVS